MNDHTKSYTHTFKAPLMERFSTALHSLMARKQRFRQPRQRPASLNPSVIGAEQRAK